MSTLTIGIIIGVVAFAGGTALSFFLWDHILVKKKNKIVSEAKTEAEVIKKEKELGKIPATKSRKRQKLQRKESEDCRCRKQNQAEGSQHNCQNGGNATR